MARVFVVKRNLKEAISKVSVVTHRNLIEGQFAEGERAMDCI